MSNSDTGEAEAAEENIRYDLAGNPLPSLPPAARPAAAPSSALPPPGTISPQQFGGTPGAGGFIPPPGNSAFTPPPGSSLGWGGAATPAQKTSGSGSALYLGLGIAAIIILGLIFVLRTLKPASVGVPTSYATYTSLDNTFSCDQPTGWDHHETGAPGGVLSTVTFTKGKVRFKVISDAEGSLMSEGTNAANANLPPELQTPAVQKLHDRDMHQLADNIPGYSEEKPTIFTSKVGDSRASEWVESEDKTNSRLHGYRITMLDKDREITVICSSPERNWAVLKPVFQHLVASIVPGNG